MFRTNFVRAVVWAMASSMPAFGLAQESAPKVINVQAGNMVDALESLAKQCGVYVMYPAEELAGFKTEGVNGTLEPRDAFRKLIEGTPLVMREEGGGIVIFLPRKQPATAATDVAAENVRLAQQGVTVNPDSGANSSQVPPPTGDGRGAGGEGKESGKANSKGAGGDSSPGSDTSKAASDDQSSDKNPSRAAVPEILVKGSRSLNMDIQRTRDGALPYVIFDREQIERSGATTIDEFLKNKLTMSYAYSSGNQVGGVNPASEINLRGLGSNQTLILVDGHRASSVSLNGAMSQPDLNGIPLSAIERIEILPTTASGIYGGSATGGAINIVLRRDFNGVQTRVGYDGTFSGGGTRRYADVSAGFGLEEGRTTVLIAASYSNSAPLLVKHRDFVQEGRAGLLAQNSQVFLDGFYPVLGSTTNICSADPFGVGLCSRYVAEAFGAGAEIPLTLKSGAALSSAFTSVPEGYAGVASDNGAQLVARAGQYNLNLPDTAQGFGGGRNALLSEPAVKSLTVTLRRDFTSRIQGFLELAASDNDSRFEGNTFGRFVLPGSAPGNPFVQDIVVTTPTFGADSSYDSTMQHRRALAGVIAQLPGNWQAEVDFTWDRTRRANSSPPTFLTPAVDTAIQSGAINLFQGNNATVNFAPYLDPASRSVTTPSDATLKDATLRLSGPLGWSLPGGAAVLSGLVEHRQEVLGASSFVNPGLTAFYYPRREQSVDSIYMETRIPFVSGANALPFLQELALTIAARHDRYTTEGTNRLNNPNQTVLRATNRFDSTDPTVSLNLKPIPDIQLRASYGTGFLPPGVAQLVSIPTPYTPNPAFGDVDPRRGNEVIGGGSTILLVGGGNPDLRPESSESRSVGLVLTPRFAPNLRISADWVRIDKHDNILPSFFLGTSPSAFDYEQIIPGIVVRGAPGGGFPVGPVTALANGMLINIAKQRVESLDLALDYRWDAGAYGTFSLATVATNQRRNNTQILPTAPVQNLVGLVNGGLEWKGNATLSWEYGQWDLAWTATYFDSYTDVLGQSVVPSQKYHDVFVRYRLGSLPGFAGMSNAEMRMGVQNVFDTPPPFDAFNSYSYYSYFGDPRMRRYSLSLSASF